MKFWKGIIFPLTILVAGAGGFMATGGTETAYAQKVKPAVPGKAAGSPEKPANSAAPNANVDIVYYFMTTQRCPSCMKIEEYTKEAVQQQFGSEIKKGSILWKMVNVDFPENRHFIKDYRLFTKSVVLVKMRSGKQAAWKNLDRVWELLRDRTAFHAYIVKELKAFREKG